jgi:hypothetical protein
MFLWTSWVPWYSLSLFCWSLDLRMFSSFHSKSCTTLFFGVGGEWFPSLFLLPIFPLGTVSIPGRTMSNLILAGYNINANKTKKEG